MESLFNGSSQGLGGGMQNASGQHHEGTKGKKGSLLTLVPMNKVKKERKPRDPNAPKRPLTAYFLYGASARPIVKGDLGETATSKEVSEEVLRRWTEMPAAEKEVSSACIDDEQNTKACRNGKEYTREMLRSIAIVFKPTNPA